MSSGAPLVDPTPVLVIEDDPRVLRVALTILRSGGFSADGCQDVPGGLQMLRDQPGHYVAVLLDYEVRGSLAPDIVPLLHELQPGMPVLVTSGRLLDLDEVPGAAGVLLKPFTIQDLVRSMREALTSPAESAV